MLVPSLDQVFFSAAFNPASKIASNIDSLLYLPSSITKMQSWRFLIMHMKRNMGFWLYPQMDFLPEFSLQFPCFSFFIVLTLNIE